MTKTRFSAPAALRLAGIALVLAIALTGLYRSVDTAIGAGTSPGGDDLPGPRCLPPQP